jgi:hypothetical protein
VDQTNPYYQLPLQAQHHTFQQNLEYQQGFDSNQDFGSLTLTGAYETQPDPGEQPTWLDPQLFDPVSNDTGPIFYEQEAVNTTKRKRSLSMSSPDSNPTRKKLRSANRTSNNSSYSSRSRRSSDTDDSERKELKYTRKVLQRGSAYRGAYKPEKPKLRDDKPWVRTNATTQGLTTRTAKINQYQPGYEDRPHPIGRSWVSPLGNTFEYTDKHEFKEKTYTTEQIRDFIFNYPKDKRTHARLKLWIQKTPTDSARRYHSVSHAKCRFKDCPAQLYQTGTILHGHYRIAIDERWHAHGLNVDPFHVAGFVHLYCMERFLDFEAVCKLGVVEVDDRAMPHEPKGRFAGSLAGQPEYHIASQFVGEARNGALRQNVAEFKNYPHHSEFKRGQEKPHKDTLTYWMHMYKQDTRPKAQIKQFEERGLKASHIIVNKGNLEVLFRDNLKRKRAAKAEKAKLKKRKVKDIHIDHEHDEEDEELVHEALKEAQQKIDKGSTPPKKRKRIFIEVTDDEESSADEAAYDGSDSDDDDDRPLCSPAKGFRKSPRLKDKKRKVYATSPTIPEEQPEVVQSIHSDPYTGYQAVDQGAQVAADFTLPVFDFDPNDPDLQDIIQHLQRRQSSVSGAVRRTSRGPSLLKSISPNLRSPKAARRVTIGGATTQLFDSAAAPSRTRRSSDRVRNSRLRKPRVTPSKY